TPADFPGMAHAQEHMMFRGSPGLSADQLAVIGSAMGGQFNAETRQTVTQYSFTVPAEDLDVALQVEALRMRDVLDRQEGWERERGAIEQEVDEDLSNPTYVLDAKLRAILFAGTSYAHDGLGTRASFDRTTGAMLKGFHDRWYVPNNAVLVVVGNIDPLLTLGKVKRYFESIPPREVPDRSSIRLQPVQAETIRLDSDLPYGLLVVAFRLPGFEDADYAAAEVLADVLSSKRADLYGLVAQGKALFTDLTVDPLPKATLAYVSIAYPNGTDVEALEREVQTILGKLAREGVSSDLIAAAKLQEKS